MRLNYPTYRFADHEEHMVAVEPDGTSARVLIVLPLFEEMNRMRRTAVMAMRNLAERRVASAIPDLPGCNESLAAMADQTLEGWTKAVTHAADQWRATHIASFRGGALIDHGPAALPHWRCAPAKGSPLLRTMVRTRIAADREAGRTTTKDEILAASAEAPVDLAGSLLGGPMIAALDAARPEELTNCRTVTLAPAGTEPNEDRITGSPLWLRAEPGEDADFASAIADHIAAWIDSA